MDDAYASHVNALLARGPESRAKLAEVAVLLEDCGLLGTLDIGEPPEAEGTRRLFACEIVV